MSCVGSSYTFQSSGTVAGNAQNSVMMAPTSNGSILLSQKQDGTTVYTRFLKVTALILSANTETRTLSWTDVGAASYDLKVQEGETLKDTLTMDDTAQVVPSQTPFVTLSFTVSCTVNGETLPDSNSVSMPPIPPSIVFQTAQSFSTDSIVVNISPNTYSLETLLSYVNSFFTASIFTFDGIRVLLTPNGFLIPLDSQYTLSTPVFLRHLGFDLGQVPLGVVLTDPIEALHPIATMQGDVPLAPTQPTDLAVSDITTTTASLTANVTAFEDLQSVTVVQSVGGMYLPQSAGVSSPSSNSVTIPITDLTPNTEQTFAIVSSTLQDLSPLSDPITFTTQSESSPPPVPTNLQLNTTTVRTPRLTWDYEGPQPGFFMVNVYQGETLLQENNTGQGFPFFDFPPDQLTLGDSFSIGVSVGGMESSRLDVTMPTTLRSPSVSASSVSSNSMILTCTDKNDKTGTGSTTFDIQIAPPNGDGTAFFADVTSPFTLTNLSPNTEYTITITARFVSGGVRTTDPSVPIAVTTLEAVASVDSTWIQGSTASQSLTTLLNNFPNMSTAQQIQGNLTSKFTTFSSSVFDANVLAGKQVTLTNDSTYTIQYSITESSVTGDVFTLSTTQVSGPSVNVNDILDADIRMIITDV